jgi:hypothetical protein
MITNSHSSHVRRLMVSTMDKQIKWFCHNHANTDNYKHTIRFWVPLMRAEIPM